MNKITTSALLIILSLLLSGCEDKPETPLEVTQAFWYSVKNKNVANIKQLVSAESAQEDLQAENIVTISDASFGKIVIDGKFAHVETDLVIDSNDPSKLPITTFLVNENNGDDDEWKVDYHATVDTIGDGSMLGQVLQDIKKFGDKFSLEFENSLDDLDRAMPEIEKEITNIGDQLKEQVPAIKKQFEDLTRKLQEALEETLKEEEKLDSI